MKAYNPFLFVITLLLTGLGQAQETKAVREYHLDIAEEHVLIEGEYRRAMTINGQYPGPVLHFREGELARVHVSNHMEVDTSIHWHGLLVPPEEDGVPYLSFFPVKPGQTYTYEFPIIHQGTFWYHSHTDLQEQAGLHGGIVIEPAQGRKQYDHEAVLILQDWTNEDPRQVLANLKKSGHYYAMKKGSTQSIAGYWQNQAMKNWFSSRWTRMGGMDISDIAYDAFLVNGVNTQELFPEARAGDQVLLRVINTGTSTYFNLHASPDLSMRIIAADGNPVEPVDRKNILHALAETYDIVLTLPDDRQYEFRASAQDGTGYSRVLIGSGDLQPAEDKPRPNLYQSHDSHNDHGGHKNDNNTDNMNMQDEHAMHHGHHMPLASEQESEWDYSLLKSEEVSSLPEGKVRNIELRLTGDMESYNWSFDGVPLSRADKIRIKKGEVVRFHFINDTMMHHPLHLHGHFFRVLAGNGAYEPIKHTVDVKPMARSSIEFYANEEKDWFFHCHNLYHAKTGMARVISYREPGTSEEEAAFMHAKMQSSDIMDSDYYYKGHVKVFDDYFAASMTMSNYLHELTAEVESFAYEFERAEWEYQYRLTRWLKPTVIGEVDEEHDDLKLGFTYTLPFLIDVGLFYTGHQETEWHVESEFQLSSRIKSHLEYGSEDEMHYGIEYRFNEQFSAEFAYINAVRYVGGLHYRF